MDAVGALLGLWLMAVGVTQPMLCALAPDSPPASANLDGLTLAPDSDAGGNESATNSPPVKAEGYRYRMLAISRFVESHNSGYIRGHWHRIKDIRHGFIETARLIGRIESDEGCVSEDVTPFGNFYDPAILERGSLGCDGT